MGIYDNYLGSKEAQVVVDGKRFDAIFPKEHSSIDGLIYKVTDHNPNQGMGCFQWLGTECYVIPKGTKELGKLFDGSACDFEIAGQKVPTSEGLFYILHILEGVKFITAEEQRKEDLLREKQAMAAILAHAKTLNW